MKRLCVFCGSGRGKSPKYVDFAQALGREMVARNIALVYGGASIGVMGAIADAVLELKGEVYGVIPTAIQDLEIAHKNLTQLDIVEDMHTRKGRMYELSDAFVAIPGGIGTLDELCEIVTWHQLLYHEKPCFILNQDGFYDHFIAHLVRARDEGFLKQEHLEIIQVVSTIDELLEKLV